MCDRARCWLLHRLLVLPAAQKSAPVRGGGGGEGCRCCRLFGPADDELQLTCCGRTAVESSQGRAGAAAADRPSVQGGDAGAMSAERRLGGCCSREPSRGRCSSLTLHGRAA